VTGTIDDLMARARAHPVIAVQVVGDATAAVQAIEEDARVERVERAGDRNGTANPELLVTLRDATMHHGFLIELLVKRSIPIHSVAPQQLKLEDVFLRLTKGIVQ
jgi:hypothetical protein